MILRESMPLSTCMIRDTKSSNELTDDENKWKPGTVEAVVEEIKKENLRKRLTVKATLKEFFILA